MKDKGVAIVIDAPGKEEDNEPVGAYLPSAFLGGAADKLKEGDVGELTVRYKVVGMSDEGVELEFTDMLDCDSDHDEHGPAADYKKNAIDRDAKDAYDDWKKDRDKRGRRMEDEDDSGEY